MRDFDSNRIYEILGEEFKNIYIVDCKTQQIHAFKETDVLPGFSAHMLYNDAMNQYIDHCVYEKNRDMLRIALSFNSLYTRLENAEHFNIHYQSKTDSEIHFMYTHFGCIKDHDKITQIVIGFANEDLDIRRNNLDMINNVITPSGLRRKVLIVEDNELNREMLKATLEDEYDVLEAVNGEDGLQILSQKLLAQRQMENDFKDAIKNREFVVYFQPKYDVSSEQIVGAEALVRWQKEDGTLISPGLFIPLFESDGLVVQLDEYVFETVCRFQKDRMKQGLPILPISVNLSRASIHFSDVVQRYVNIIKENEIPFSCVPIELTESAALYSQQILEITNQMVNAGFKLHMDDFGSGYSSLTTLNELKFTTVKLDKSLIDYIAKPRGMKIVRQTIDLGHGLDMKVVAEGVETKEQRDCLIEINCDEIQGFYYSKPLKQDDFIEKLRA